ncbi:MAG: SDR family oxidoreductase [Anaerolineaceae bacterium]|nr:SDR family oxidoreductase [Anaerolineaceae bacterium]
MKVIFIGGSGNISTSVSRLAIARGIELTLLNRGKTQVDIPGARWLTADFHNLAQTQNVLGDETFDVVVDWIAFTQQDIERDLALFAGKTGQFVFISSASAYQKPPSSVIIRESTPLHNPFWQYSRNKIACEERLIQAYREQGFPVTIVRPSHTYDKYIPIAVGDWDKFTIVDRMRKGLPVIVHGDGTSLWTVTHADDFAVGFLGLLGHPGTLGQAFHITSDERLTWNDIYRAIGSAVGVEPNIVHIASEFIVTVAPDYLGTLIGDKSWSVIFDNSKIKSYVPEYQAVIPFHQGIKRTIAQFEADPERCKVDTADHAEIERILKAYGM